METAELTGPLKKLKIVDKVHVAELSVLKEMRQRIRDLEDSTVLSFDGGFVQARTEVGLYIHDVRTL